MLFLIAKQLIIASNAPAAPKVFPNIDLGQLKDTVPISFPQISFNTFVSMTSSSHRAAPSKLI